VTWETSGVVEVAPEVHRIPLPLPGDALRTVNVYALLGDEGVVLVDAGWAIATARETLETALRSLHRSLADVRMFAVTHAHRDHYTQAITLRREFGTKVALGHGERPSLNQIMKPGASPLRRRAERLRLLGAGTLATRIEAADPDTYDAAAAGYELPDQWLHGGDELRHGDRVLEVVETPGHTRGHVIFHDRIARVMFSGDHVLPTITPSVGYEASPAENPLGAFLASLALVRSRPDAQLLPGHGPVAPSVHARVDELVAHHGTRLDAAMVAVLGGAELAAEVAARLPWTRRERSFEDLDDFNQALAVMETAAHLDLLVAQGRVQCSEVDGLRAYVSP
jgi:glyoxylase-like metal-dependent hydrolase (beta-lactamase superfamily II)